MINYIKGYYIIVIEGVDTEKYLNFICKNNIPIYDVKRINKVKLEFKVSRRDYKKIKSIYRGNKFKIKVKQKLGIPFLARRIYKHKIMLLSGIVSLLLLLVTTQFITDVKIECPEGIDKEVLQEQLQECGLKPGTYKKSIDRRAIRDYIMKEIDEVAYVSINIKGTNVFVSITKKDDNKVKDTNLNYFNVIASKNGIIEKVIARSGESVVKTGDIVQKGDLLIQGANASSMPEVWATTFYESNQKKAYIQFKNNRTGNSKKVYSINFYGKKFEIMRSIKYKDYEIENKVHQIKIGDYTFPVKIVTSTFYEIEKKQVKVSMDKLKEDLKKRALKDLEYIMAPSARKVDVNYKYKVSQNMLEYMVTVQASEDISKVHPLNKNEINQIIQENSKGEDGEEVPSNPSKRRIDDVKNQFENKKDKKEDNTENN